MAPPQYTIERYVGEHARDDAARHAELVGLVHNEQRQRRSDGVTDDGNKPINASSPKRTPVPGMTSAVSSRVASASIRAMRAPRERGRAMSKPYVVVIGGPSSAALNGYAGRRAQAFLRSRKWRLVDDAGMSAKCPTAAS